MTQSQQSKTRLWVSITLLMCQSHLFLSFHFIESQYYCCWKESDDKRAPSQQLMRTIKVKEEANHHHPKENPPTPRPWSSCDSRGTRLWVRAWAAADVHPPESHSSQQIVALRISEYFPLKTIICLFHLRMNQSRTCSRAALEECKKLR